jgi:N-methylhydantoinase A
VLGYLDPSFFLGGRLGLDLEAARRAVAGVAEATGMTLEEAAHAGLLIATEGIVGAIKEITIAQGIDPREVSIVAGGGASGLVIVPIARELGCRRVLVPSTAGALSACGALTSDVIGEFAISRYAETRDLDLAAVNDALAAVGERADAFLGRLADVGPVTTRVEYSVDARYRSQVWELDVPLPGSRLGGEADVRGLENAFHAAHERVFRVSEPGQYVECLVWKARAVASLETPSLAARPVLTAGDPAAGSAPAYFRELGSVDVARYDGGTLPAGTTIEGPAIVREPTTTVVVYPGSSVTVTALGNYLLELSAGEREPVAARERAAA